MAGDRGTITVTWGEEVFTPIKYYSFRVGPFSYTTTQMIGETMQQAFDRANELLTAHADKIFTAKRNAFIERVKAARIAGQELMKQQ